MSCFESDIEIAFNNALSIFSKDRYQSQLFNQVNPLFFKRLDTVSKGKNFLKSINELKNLVGSQSHPFFDQFIETATKTMNAPTSQNHGELRECLRQLSGKLIDLSSWDFGLKISAHSVGLLVGAIFAINPTIIPIVAAVATTTIPNPVLLIVLSAVVMFIGVVLIAYEIYKLCQDVRYIKSNQFKEIRDFINHLEPFISVSNEGVFDADAHPLHEGMLGNVPEVFLNSF